MIDLHRNKLEIRFPEIHPYARVDIEFKRTLRVPDNSENHYLPPDLGNFPLRHIEDIDLKEKNHLKKRGGVIMPMFQADALWINFFAIEYPIAIKIGTGKICAISGETWTAKLSQNPQDYVVVPGQEWLDGYNIDKTGTVRQFVAAPLGKGLTVEEQLNMSSEVGGIQIQAFPLKPEVYRKKFSPKLMRASLAEESYSIEPAAEMGIAQGGMIHQEIYADEFSLNDWDLKTTERCFVTIANANQWMSLTGETPPESPISAKEYTDAGLPWFDYYDEDKEAIDGALKLGKVKSASEILSEKNINVNEINKSNPFFSESIELIKRRMNTTRYLNEKRKAVSNPKSGW
tara:strand:+ start:2466 stop:3500 length:1035 start_codon:yes stop_codon:yes gene_type:complete